MRTALIGIVVALVHFSIPAFAVKLRPGSPDPDNKARAAALDRIQQLSAPGTRAFLLEETSALKRATLGTPFVQFWTDDSFVTYGSAPPGDNIMGYVGRYCISFPVVLDARVLGTVDVIREDGNYRVVSTHTGDEQFKQVDIARRGLNLAAGERLSIFTAVGFGSFFVIENGTSFLRMSPLEVLSTEIRLDAKAGGPQFLSEENFSAGIKNAIRRSKTRAAEVNDENWKTLDD